MDVIAETGYAINQTAQSLSMQSAENIGLLVSETVYKTRYFSELIRLTTQFALEHNKKLIVTDARADTEDERQGIARLENQQCAVILIMSVSMGSAELGRIIERSTSEIILINKRLSPTESISRLSLMDFELPPLSQAGTTRVRETSSRHKALFSERQALPPENRTTRFIYMFPQNQFQARTFCIRGHEFIDSSIMLDLAVFSFT